MQPPQLHQPTVDMTKDMSQTNKSKTVSKNRPRNDTTPAPIRVIRPPNAFLLFNKELRKRLKDQNPTMKVAEISKEIGERWKNLSQTDKDYFVNEANKIKETQRAMHPNSMYIRRSKAELTKAGHYSKSKKKNGSQMDRVDNPLFAENGSVQILNIPESSLSAQSPSRKKHRRDKNPGAPKHPLSAYMWYLTEVRPETMRTYPGSTVGQISKLCADRWNTMSEVERMPWKTKAQADKARYAREMQVYAAHNDHPMGRGTRQKYRSAAAAAAAAAAAMMSTSSASNQECLLANEGQQQQEKKRESLNPSNTSFSAPASPSSILCTSLPETVHDSMNPSTLLQSLPTSLPSTLHNTNDTDQYVNTG
ncbi:Non-histone chromosomal protein 6 [Apophysomyces sp. BC1034]|nr:Non-histone chromosomal protein 6 [Apophysomyces sp. BC1021]KAG0185767.1 Non-histone chromosomal protein 6 [Apophysomyces sp. BC1034]